MDLEELNKTQIILLTLLVSFVSAIATSIFTVKILEEAPPVVTQTINRVVERTIERVVPAESNSGSGEQTIIEKETTVVVKENDLITESIDKNKRKIVRLVNITETEGEPVGTSTEPTINREILFHGIGIIVSSDGLIATSKKVGDLPLLVAIANDGSEYTATMVNSSENISYLQLEKGEEKVSLSPVTFVDESTLKLGQSVISLGGEDRTSVSTGIIASFVEDESSFVGVRTNITGSIPGSPLVNIFGEVVGIDVLGTPGLFTTSALIKSGIHREEALEEGVVQTLETEEVETTEG
jgi:S1-C subfamily serine protease